MSLTGLEAFVNTYFHLRGLEKGSKDVISRLKVRSKISRKIEVLVNIVGDGQLIEQESLINEIFALSETRNDIVHPKWVPTNVVFIGQSGNQFLNLENMVENPYSQFESLDYCRRALNLAVLTILRIGQSRGADLEGFVWRWTGFQGVSLEAVLADLDELARLNYLINFP